MWTRKLSVATALLLLNLAATGRADNDVVMQIDPFGVDTRMIPDLANGGEVALAEDEIIDFVILGDGYLGTEADAFFDDATEFWADYLHPDSGLRPFRFFSQAFRVRAIFNTSPERASPDRNSYYRVSLSSDCPKNSCVPDNCTGCVIESGSWPNDAGVDNELFRQRLFESIYSLDPPVNSELYPERLSVEVPTIEPGSADILPPLCCSLRNIYVLMLVRVAADVAAKGAKHKVVSSMQWDDITDCTGCSGMPRVQLGLEGGRHELLGHAFGHLQDEYIDDRDATATLTNPSPQSVYLLSNLAYSNSRSEVLWEHLAPGGLYNPNVTSPLSNLYLGGGAGGAAGGAMGVWHAEYNCMMNGKHDNYVCDIQPGEPEAQLFVGKFCFWCEEILTVRILEKTKQFGSDVPTNVLGETWFTQWESQLRDAYYTRFNIAELIAERNACYGFGECVNPNGCTECDEDDIPACLLSCDVTELVNGVYVDPAAGAPGNPGTRTEPLDTVMGGVSEASVSGRDIVAIEPGAIPGPMVISEPVILIPSTCDPVVLGY